jgi:hypothetical protein
MVISTLKHLIRVYEIAKEDGFRKALDYDIQITRSRSNIADSLLAGIDLYKHHNCWVGDCDPSTETFQREVPAFYNTLDEVISIHRVENSQGRLVEKPIISSRSRT